MPESIENNRIGQVSDEALGLEDRLIRYLRDFNRWTHGDGTGWVEIYEPNPMYVISEVIDEREREDCSNLEFDYEWNRGEIGVHQKEGNFAYSRQILFINTVLRRIHLVSFDNGKKRIVAPDYKAIGKGRFYHYLSDSLQYAYQRFHFRDERTDHSKELRKLRSEGSFDIPVLKDEEELQRFVEYCGKDIEGTQTSDKEEQTTLFYALLDKYEEFKRQEV